MEEAYTTEHWIVRIYRVKKTVNKSKKLGHKPIVRKNNKKLKRKGKKGVFRVKLNQSLAKKTRKASRNSLKL